MCLEDRHWRAIYFLVLVTLSLHLPDLQGSPGVSKLACPSPGAQWRDCLSRRARGCLKTTTQDCACSLQELAANYCIVFHKYFPYLPSHLSQLTSISANYCIDTPWCLPTSLSLAQWWEGAQRSKKYWVGVKRLGLWHGTKCRAAEASDMCEKQQQELSLAASAPLWQLWPLVCLEQVQGGKNKKWPRESGTLRDRRGDWRAWNGRGIYYIFSFEMGWTLDGSFGWADGVGAALETEGNKILV